MTGHGCALLQQCILLLPSFVTAMVDWLPRQLQMPRSWLVFHAAMSKYVEHCWQIQSGNREAQLLMNSLRGLMQRACVGG